MPALKQRISITAPSKQYLMTARVVLTSPHADQHVRSMSPGGALAANVMSVEEFCTHPEGCTYVCAQQTSQLLSKHRLGSYIRLADQQSDKLHCARCLH